MTKEKMTHSEYVAQCRTRLAKACGDLIRGEASVIATSRLICSLEHGCELDTPGFIGFTAIESETDDYPLGETRQNWNADYLAELDAEFSSYEDRCRPGALENAEVILRSLRRAGQPDDATDRATPDR